MSTTIQLLQHTSDLLAANPIPNPPPKAPPGVEKQASDVMSFIKWGALFLIVAGGMCGVGALVGGKVLGHHKSASVGVGILIVAVIAGAIWAGWFGFIGGFTG